MTTSAARKKTRRGAKKSPPNQRKTGYMVKILLVGSVLGGGVYLGSGGLLSHIPFFSRTKEATAAASAAAPKGEPADVQKKEIPKPKKSEGSVFSEGDAPIIVGDVPAGWRVEPISEIKAKFAPKKVEGAEEVTFVVPAYTLVPEDREDTVYVIEPGRTQDGENTGGTLDKVLDRMSSESGAVGKALDSLSKAIGGLARDEKEPSVRAPKSGTAAVGIGAGAAKTPR